MASLPSLVGRLPTLYRPEPEDRTLLVAFLAAVAAELDHARDETGRIMPAHWSRHADRATFDPWFTLRRSRASLTSLTAFDRLDFQDARKFLKLVKDARSALTAHLRAELDDSVRALLDAWRGTKKPPESLQREVLNGLGRVVRGDVLWNEDRFDGVDIDPDLASLAASPLSAVERAAVNVELLLQAFPDSLRPAHLDLAWVRDLARLAAIVPLVPWREPASLRESVEAFRIRLARMVALYRRGLGTVGALRGIVEATLPVDPLAPEHLRDRPFTVEEFAPLTTFEVDATTNGSPDGLVGPLMRWSIENHGMAAVTPTLLITGATPGPGIQPAASPMIELFAAVPGAGFPRIAVGYAGTLSPEQTLRLRPGLATWTLGDDGVLRAEHDTSADDVDPTSPGEPAEVPDAPDNAVAIAWTVDGMIWIATEDGAIHRFDGEDWTEAATGLESIRCLAAERDSLLIGTADGLLRLPLFPAEGDPFETVAVEGFEDLAVRVIVRADRADRHAGGAAAAMDAASTGGWWIGTDTGALRWTGESEPEAVPLGGDLGIEMAVSDIHVDADGNAVHFAGEAGVFEYQPARDTWFWFAGGTLSEIHPDWLPLGGGAASPSDGAVFLPAVNAVHRGPDAMLWFGTEQGIAAYAAVPVDGTTTYTTVLLAFPDVCVDPVTQIFEDVRGGVWFCTARGLLRFDGRDWWQRRGGDWIHLGRADLLSGTVARPRGAWRFERASSQWQRFDTAGAVWVVPAFDERTTAEPAVTRALMTDAVAADLGAIVDDVFEPDTEVPPADVFLRVKPDAERILDGGVPYIPACPQGESQWRYLARETEPLEEPPVLHRPAWSTEGRLFPPPAALDAPYPGRFDIAAPPEGRFDQAVFAYDPAARVTFGLAEIAACSVLVRLLSRAGDPKYDPAILDRVLDGIALVRPAGVRVALAVDDTIVTGS
jgi:hypothetical protein